MRKVKLYIACSIDGYIATRDGDIGFLDQVAVVGEDYGYESFMKTIDTIIMGRKTYEKILSFDMPFPHQKELVYVFSNTLTGKNEYVTFIDQDVKAFIETLKQKKGKDIFLDGGAHLIRSFLDLNLVDDMIISIVPVLLGDGIPLFLPGLKQSGFKLVASTSFESGLVQLHYQKLNQ